MLQYIQHQQIDFNKWDNCVKQAHNSLLYAHSFYLNIATNNQWHALVLNDYEAVMPLIFRKKYGITYLYQPAFLQQTGIYSNVVLEDVVMQQFIIKATSLFKFIEINLNYAQPIFVAKNIAFKRNNNFIINLQESFVAIQKNYCSPFKKSVQSAKNKQLQYSNSNNYNDIIDLYKKLYAQRVTSFKNNDFIFFKKICAHLYNQQQIVIRIVTHENNLVAAVILLKDDVRLYNIISCTTTEGKILRANHFLYNELIKEFATKPFILDLEGSDVPGIAAFYQSMGAVNQPYYFMKYNQLPKMLQLIKK